ncbi:Plus-3 domain [Arabidopsis thaliana x Arabidopsis arenosa]|uniref:Plus-3 domain n=1 Tax=Arabidopsis thaliana x Arabidopsis arenosa TaxID=1240361 RepID=A0A8T2CS92_9BRAS|nr:Plus-3 domain [Arabidopsis thaliana x Arabidopsis arenosa]
MEDDNEKVKGSSKKRLRKPKSLEFVGWGSRNLIEFLESLGRDTTNKISENDVTAIIMNYIREKSRETPLKSKKRRKTVACDEKLRLLFEDDKQQRLSLSDKVAKQTKQVVSKPRGTFAAIVRDNVKLLYLRKSLVQELAKTPETFESKVVGTFVRIKNPCQLVHVTGVKEGDPIDGNLFQVTNYSYYLKDVTTSSLSDDDFSQEECEELHQRINNGFAKRLTVVDMEEKARSLHEDYLEKRELLQNPDEQKRLVDEVPEIVAEELEPECEDDDDDRTIEDSLIVPNPEAHQSDKEQRQRDLPVSSSVKKSQENSMLLKNPEEQLRLLCDVPDVVAEKLEPEFVDDDGKLVNDVTVPNPEAFTEAHQSDEEIQPSDLPDSSIQKTLEDQPIWTASAGNKDLHEDVYEPPANGITLNTDSITEGEMNTKVSQHQSSTPVIDLSNKTQAHSNPIEIIELSDDDDDDEKDKNDQAYQSYDPKKVMWFYEYPKGKTHRPFSLTDLKTWSDEEYFVGVPDFKVWKTGESAVLLTKLLSQIKT